MADNKTLVINFLKKNPNSTLSAIAKGALDKSKARDAEVKLIDELFTDGLISSDTSGRYTTYSVVEASSKKSVSKNEEVVVVEKEVVAKAKKIAGDMDCKILEMGFKIEVAKTEGKVKITLPSSISKSNKSYTINSDSFLLVINEKEDEVFEVADPADVLASILDFTKRMGIAVYSIKDVISSKEIRTKTDVELGRSKVVLFRVEKHNKAAC